MGRAIKSLASVVQLNTRSNNLRGLLNLGSLIGLKLFLEGMSASIFLCSRET